MKLFLSILVLTVLLGLGALLWPSSNDQGEINPILNAAATTQPATRVNPVVPVPASGLNATATVSSKAATPTSENSSITKAATVSTKAATAVVISSDSLKEGLDKKFGNATTAPGNILKQSDGSILADNKYLIGGSGTKEDPYRITWECLTSASQTYIPRLQQNIIPQRIALLDDKWVRIEGYLAFPLMLQESSEILMMLNQWDGCCIGVPPTPYDAIEVKLSVPAKPGRLHTFNFGTITGKFKVDPYLVENWLVGLYQIESATLNTEM